MMILLPAYSRDYSSQKAVLVDFYNDRDFVWKEWGKPDVHINCSQINDREVVTFRYYGMTRVFSHTVKKG